jgi:3',5'-cyclic-AMP phosphodiesterase
LGIVPRTEDPQDAFMKRASNGTSIAPTCSALEASPALTWPDDPAKQMSSSRRDFLRVLGISALALSLPGGAAASLRRLTRPIRIGFIADLHHDLMHDSEARLDDFLQTMDRIKAGAIVQLGDFAYPNKRNQSVIDRFNKAHEHSLHVIGNHDMDAGHTRQHCFDLWGMKGRFYTHDIGGLRLLVLDGNDAGSPTHRGGYPSFIGQEQTAWLEEQLGKEEGPFLVLSHQPLAGVWPIDNAMDLQPLLARYADKVLLCVNGHSHVDDLLRVQKVSYLHVNSASYFWVGDAFRHESYPSEIHAQRPWISRTCPYRDSLFTVLTFDPGSATITVMGKESTWVGKSPAELGADPSPQIILGEQVLPRIRTRRLEWPNR